MRTAVITCVLAGALAAVLNAQAGRAAGMRVSTKTSCAADLGSGVKSKRSFCDVVITATPGESVLVPIPERTGVATLRFDLHNRFTVPVVAGQPMLAFQRHEAIVAVIRPNGVVLGKAIAIREFRSTADTFDLIAGGGRPGGVKAVAPGPAESIRVSIPAGVTEVGIVGLRLRARTNSTGPEVFDTPGRPIAIASNVRVEYRAR
jgi:hypothetical protein